MGEEKDMEKKIIGIFIMMLLIVTSSLNSMGNIANNKIVDENIEIIEQENYGCNDEEFLSESFDGTFPPDGWTTDDFIQSNSNYAGGTSPEAKLCYSTLKFDLVS